MAETKAHKKYLKDLYETSERIRAKNEKEFGIKTKEEHTKERQEYNTGKLERTTLGALWQILSDQGYEVLNPEKSVPEGYELLKNGRGFATYQVDINEEQNYKKFLSSIKSNSLIKKTNLIKLCGIEQTHLTDTINSATLRYELYTKEEAPENKQNSPRASFLMGTVKLN